MENLNQNNAAVAEIETLADQPVAAIEEQTEVRINEHKLTQYLEQLKLEQNLPLAFIGGLAIMAACALVWAGITIATKYQIGYMAIGVGLAVGFGLRYLGKGTDKIFGILGAVLALSACLLGNFLSVVGITAQEAGMGYLETLGMIDMALIPQIMIETFSPMDVLFYGLAVYEGYKFSFRQITEEDIYEHAAERVPVSQ